MTQIALLHSALGIRAGITDAAARLEADGHEVEVVDYYGAGRVFDDYGEASAFVDEIGFPELMRRALAGCEGLADGFIAMGFSNGAGMAEHVALNRSVGGVVMASGALPLEMLGATRWPAGVRAQIHSAAGDAFRDQVWLDAVAAAVRGAAPLDLHDDYPGTGHLFTDESLPAEYDADAAALFWDRVRAFCGR
ncbi:dienelactone hydrolase family protein [Patulibacter americanus]|uniref:dienelactone hydrolase family protein n=1 Tax=Patulibacter americanus TaxID=588672 RepID=UPI0003B76807|nr:dienelactone hydrolase family protein [Patulibacter americanus]